jgi:hypothetical protein
MGRKDPERQQAIKAELVEMEPTAEEEFHDFLETCETEDSRAIEETNEFQDRVNRIDAENKRLGLVPAEWFNALECPSAEDFMVRDALIERWEREMTVQSVTDEIDEYNDGINWNSSTGQIEFDDWPYDYYDGARYEPLTDEEVAEEKAAEDMYADRFDGPGDYLDEWSGNAMPMSAVDDLVDEDNPINWLDVYTEKPFKEANENL